MSYIHDDAAYQAAIRRNIQNNARKTNWAKWCARPDCRQIEALLTKYSWHSFVQKMNNSFLEWSHLTEGQIAALRSVTDKLEAKQAEKDAVKAAENALKQHVGTIGERRNFNLTCSYVTDYEGPFGFVNIYVFEDDDRNVIVYKGTSMLYVGDITVKKDTKVVLKATVKAHETRLGVPQTIISRPKIISLDA